MENVNNEIKRTRGDGMEFNVEKSKTDYQQISNESFLSKLRNLHQQQNLLNLNSTPTASTISSTAAIAIPGQHSIYRHTESDNISLPAIVPKGKIFHLVPRLILSSKKRSETFRNREPRFIPFEPYKAAVKPIVPLHKSTKKQKSRNNLDLNTLVSHMADMKCSSFEKNCANVSIAPDVFEDERKKYQHKIQELENDKRYAEAQLKSQVQVNMEIKNLLVAAVGEDLQTRVNVLTEDKLQLARALMSTAQNLSSHTEQIEYLAGQSEVWRSKFLASSLMVEELARWKASLMQKNHLLLESNKQMLETISQLRAMQVESLKNLKFLAQLKSLNLRSSNVLDVTAECLNISQQLILHSGIGMPSNVDLTGLDSTTNAEKLAVQALQNSNEPLMSTDEAFKAIVGQAFNPLRSDRNAIIEHSDKNL